MSRPLELLNAQVSSGQSKQSVANAIGYSRTAVSLYINGKYPGDATDLEVAILKTYDRRDCPHTGESIDPLLCKRKAHGPKPFGGAARAAWWQTCQTCPNKPSKGA